MARRSRFARRVFASLLPKIDAVTSSSREALEFAAALAPSASTRYELILPGADVNVFGAMTRDAARSALGIETEERIVLAVGRHVAPKGLDVLLRTRSRLPDNVLFVLIGDGPLRREHEALAASHRGQTRFLGQLDRWSVARWMAAADVLAVPSVRHRIQGADTGPVVVMEALASACPVVATDVGLAREVIQDGSNGFVVPSGDRSALAMALAEVLNAPAEYSARAKRSFDVIGGWERSARQFGDLYQQVIA